MKPILTFAIAVLVVGLSSLAALAKDDKPEFALPALGTFDGSTWAGLTLGRSTGNDVKNLYKIDKHGNTIPWSLRPSSPKGSGYIVNALFSGRDDGKDVLAGILIRYEVGPSLQQIADQVGDNGQSYYLRGRNSDWFFDVFPTKGIIALVDHTYGLDAATAVLLVQPSLVAKGCLNLVPQRTRIEPIIDPHAGEPKIMVFGSVDVTTSSLTGMALSEHDVDSMKDVLRGATASGTMIFQSYAPGHYTADISGSYDPNKGGSVTANCSIAGVSPYGPVQASGQDTENIPSKADLTHGSYFADAFYKARSNAEGAFATAMRAQGPPTPDQIRRAAWNGLFTSLRQAAQSNLSINAAVPPGVVF